MQEHKHTKPSIVFPDMFPALLVLFFIVTIVGVLLLSYQQMLAKTAPQSLQEHDNKVIERCAKVCEELRFTEHELPLTVVYQRKLCADAIRALKGKQNE